MTTNQSTEGCQSCTEAVFEGFGATADIQPATTIRYIGPGEAKWRVCPECADLIDENIRVIEADSA